MIDFNKIKAILSIVNERTFKISVQVKDGSCKEFIFRTLHSGNLDTWVSLINLNICDPKMNGQPEIKASTKEIPDLAP